MIGPLMRWSGSLLLAAMWFDPHHAFGQDAAEDRSQSFQAVQGPVTEDIAGGPLLLAAYAIIWLALFAYLYRLHSLQARTQSELGRIEKLLSEAPAAAPDEG